MSHFFILLLIPYYMLPDFLSMQSIEYQIGRVMMQIGIMDIAVRVMTLQEKATVLIGMKPRFRIVPVVGMLREVI